MVSLSFSTPMLHFEGFHVPSEGALAAPAPKRRRHLGTFGFSAMMTFRLA